MEAASESGGMLLFTVCCLPSSSSTDIPSIGLCPIRLSCVRRNETGAASSNSVGGDGSAVRMGQGGIIQCFLLLDFQSPLVCSLCLAAKRREAGQQTAIHPFGHD